MAGKKGLPLDEWNQGWNHAQEQIEQRVRELEAERDRLRRERDAWREEAELLAQAIRNGHTGWGLNAYEAFKSGITAPQGGQR